VAVEHPFLGDLELPPACPDRRAARVLFCENETKPAPALGDSSGRHAREDDASITWSGGADTVNPQRSGRMCCLVPGFTESGGTAELRLRLRPAATGCRGDRIRTDFTRTCAASRGTDEFYAALTPPQASRTRAP